MFGTILIAGAVAISPVDALAQARGAALQADVKRAIELIEGVKTESLSDKDRKFVICMRQRFGSSKAAAAKKPNSFTDRALAIYQSYWHVALMKPEKREGQEKRLDVALRKLLNAPKEADLDSTLEKHIQAEGYHSLEGRTGLLRELMVWGKQREERMAVALPEGRYDVKVVYLSGFKSFGWSHYATCGRSSTGGWTTDDALYVVVPRYDSLDDEDFRVNFLGHESQHFADKLRFKHLESWELEYRAKLTELVLADKTRAKILSSFINDQGDDPTDPHSYADRMLLNELIKRLQLGNTTDLYTVDPVRLQAAARDALLDDSRQRQAAVVSGSIQK